MTAEALRQYILGLGASQAILHMEWDAIWTTNKKIIDPIAPRYYAVEKQNRHVPSGCSFADGSNINV